MKRSKTKRHMKRFLLITFLLFSSFSAHARHVESALSAQKAHIGDFFENAPNLHPADQLYLIELHIAYNDFSAQDAHRPLNLWYFRARYFSDEMGRFISRDPLGYVDGMSLYNGYFAESFKLDPLGTCVNKCDIEWLKKGAVVGAKMRGYKLHQGVRYRVDIATTDPTADELNEVARVIFGEAGATQKVNDEMKAMASVVYNRLGKWENNKSLTTITKVISSPRQFLAYGGAQYKLASEKNAPNLDPIACKKLKAAIEAVKIAFHDNKRSEYNSFQKGKLELIQ